VSPLSFFLVALNVIQLPKAVRRETP